MPGCFRYLPIWSESLIAGILTRYPENGQNGSYAFKVVATDNLSLNTEYLDVTVADDL